MQDRPSCRHTPQGFTLIEPMIMAALAMPSYESYMRKVRRTDAKNALLDLAMREEKYFSIHNRAFSFNSIDLGAL